MNGKQGGEEAGKWEEMEGVMEHPSCLYFRSTQPSLMTVKAGDPKPLLHWEAEEAIQLNTRLLEGRRKLYLI